MIAGAQSSRLPLTALYTQGFWRVAVATPVACPAQPSGNTREIIAPNPILMIGAPFRIERTPFNGAILIHHNAVLGGAPTSCIPNCREFYERQQVSAAGHAPALAHRILDLDVPFGTDLVFKTPHWPGLADASARNVSAESWNQALWRNVL